jgi:hypothetical protein
MTSSDHGHFIFMDDVLACPRGGRRRIVSDVTASSAAEIRHPYRAFISQCVVPSDASWSPHASIQPYAMNVTSSVDNSLISFFNCHRPVVSRVHVLAIR